jgi:Helix-turn-helix domain
VRPDQTDADLKAIWRDNAEGRLSDADAQAAAEAAYARRGRREGNDTGEPLRLPTGLPRATARRAKIFGQGRGRPMDRNAKARLMHLARALTRRTEKGRHYGVVTAKALGVLEALLWGFHNARDGRCFPSYERIAEAAHCARSTVYEAIAALEVAGLLTWVNRIKRVREWAPGLPGVGASRVRVVRSSNAYAFNDPQPGGSSKSDFQSGTANQELFSSIASLAAVGTKLAFEGAAAISQLTNARRPV